MIDVQDMYLLTLFILFLSIEYNLCIYQTVNISCCVLCYCWVFSITIIFNSI